MSRFRTQPWLKCVFSFLSPVYRNLLPRNKVVNTHRADIGKDYIDDERREILLLLFAPLSAPEFCSVRAGRGFSPLYGYSENPEKRGAMHSRSLLPRPSALHSPPFINSESKCVGVCVCVCEKVYLKSASALCRARKRTGCRSITACRSEQVRRMRKGMNVDGDCSMSVNCGNGKLRQWLIEQIDSGEYPGLVWENEEKTIFRIPWKHAGKQDYNRDEDAALFKAWALFKGKYREGVDKPDPPTWKTRLRCALNKSNDFDELVERSQLDISDPYKVYRIIPEGAKRGSKSSSIEDSSTHPTPISYPMHSSYTPLQPQMTGYMMPQDRRDWRDFGPEQPHHPPPHAEIPYGPYSSRPLQWHTQPCDNGYQISGSFYTYTHSESHPVSVDPNMRSAEAMALSDFRLHVSLYYRETLVKEVTTTSPEGCRISSSPSPSSPSSPSSPCVEDRLFGGPEPVLFPFPYPQSQRRGADKLPNVLERGVLLWLTPDGLYAKRLCQSRVYWEGPLAPYSDKPNKLEKEQTCKLLDTQHFLSELQGFIHNGRPVPRYQVVLCFGDEYPDPQRQSKMITAQVEPMFARQLVYYAGQTSGHYLRGYELPTQGTLPVEEYPRSLQHMQE